MENAQAAINAITKASKIMGSRYKLAKALNMPHQTLYRWAHGQAIPSPISCLKIEKVTNGQVKKEEILPDYPWDDL